MCNLAKIHHWRDLELSLPRLRSWTTMAAAWRCTHDTGSLEWMTMAAAVEELAVFGPVKSWRWRRSSGWSFHDGESWFHGGDFGSGLIRRERRSLELEYVQVWSGLRQRHIDVIGKFYFKDQALQRPSGAVKWTRWKKTHVPVQYRLDGAVKGNRCGLGAVLWSGRKKPLGKSICEIKLLTGLVRFDFGLWGQTSSSLTTL